VIKIAHDPKSVIFIFRSGGGMTAPEKILSPEYLMKMKK
jgi:hypothetical protein